MYFLISEQYNISKTTVFGAPKLHSWGRYTYAPADFFVWNSVLKNFYLDHFLIYLVFLAASSPKMNLLSRFCALQYLKDGNLQSHQAPLPREMDISAHWLFCMEFNAQQFLFETNKYNACFWQSRILKWIYFPIFVHYNISKKAIFGAP